MDLSVWLEHHADFAPDRVVLHAEDGDHSWAMLRREVGRLAGALAGLGIGAGDRVAHLGYNSPLFLMLLFACARLGAILVPLNWRLAAPEHGAILANAEPKLLLHDAAFAEHAARLGASRALAIESELAALIAAADERAADPDASDEQPVLIVYTSGTTGRAKGAVLTQRALLWNAVNSTLMHDLTSDDHVLTTLPLFHVGGLNIQTLPALHAGARVTLHRRFDAGATLDAIARVRPSLTVLVPAQLTAMLEHPRWHETDLSSLRAITTGSSIVPIPLIEAVHARGVPVIQVYGSTETAPIAIYQTRREAFAAIGSCGKPALHGAARIVDRAGRDVAPGTHGEILIRGPQVMEGYWRDPAATAAALAGGWFHTGDIGHVDARGFYYIDERKHDVIISGGENIYPAEIEAILLADPRIAEAAVVAHPDPRWGEVPVAVVVRRPGKTLTAAEVLALFTDRLARFKHPHAVLFAEALPKNALGKVLRHELRRSLVAAKPQSKSSSPLEGEGGVGGDARGA
jgi:fatty-acyl-CoA synthase